MLVWCGICRPCCLFSLCLSLQVSHQAPHWLVHLVVLICYQLDLVWLEMSLLRLFILITKWPDHGIEPFCWKEGVKWQKMPACLLYVLPANRFSHKLCSLFLGQDQVWAIQDPIPPVSIKINWDWVSWMTFIYTTFHMCVLVATSGWKSPSNCSLTEDASPKSSCALSNQVHRFLSESKTKKANHLWRSPGSEARTKVQLAIVFLVTRRGELSV